jgi:ankyrin repeat protein
LGQEKKEAQRPAVMKRLSLGSMMHNNSSKKENNHSSKANIRRRSVTGGEKPKESALFTKMKKPPPNNNLSPTLPTTPSEIELIMSTSNKEGNENALLPLHINPSEPFLLDDYLDPFFDIDPTTGEPRSVASMNAAGSNPNSPNNHTHKPPNRQFKSLRKRKSRPPQPRTPATSFWASLKILEGRRNRDGATTATGTPVDENSEIMDPSESNHPEANPNDPETMALSDPKMTTALHEAARLGNAELVRLMLQHPFVEPNFKNGQKRTALHMVAGGWTEPEERLWRALQQKRKTKLNHKYKNQGSGGLKRDTPQADIGISAPQPIEIEIQDGTEEGKNGRSGAQKAARAMSRFFQTKFSSNKKSTAKGGAKGEASLEPQGYLVWDEQLWNRLKTDRMDCLLAILTWSHPEDGTSSAGENASVNAVDGQGRTALHYAAELGREDICMAVLSSFGAMLTVVDDSARTPCELAADQNHPELAAQLEARALLYSDPYGMDDELLAAVMAEQHQLDENDLDASEGENIAVVKARMSLVAPFSWFQTLDMNKVEKERSKRLAECCKGMMAHIAAKEQENELKKVMYGMEEEGGDNEQEREESDANMCNRDEKVPKEEKKESERAQAGRTRAIFASRRAEDATQSQESDGSTNPAGKEDPETALAVRGGSDTAKESASNPGAKGETAENDDKNLTDDDLLSIRCIQTANIAQFLSRHGWIVEKALEAFANHPVKTLEEAGVPLKALLRAKQRSNSKAKDANEDSISSSLCLICFDEFDIADCDNWTHLENCSHSFCNTCLGEYLADCAQSRSTGLCVPCPHHECFVPMAQPEIKSLVPTPETFQILQKTANDNFVASASDLRFCPHPGCDGVVKVSITPAMKKWGIDYEQLAFAGAVCTAVHKPKKEPEFDVLGNGPPPVTYEGVVDLCTTDARSLSLPKSAHRFCFGCGDSKYHFPVTCESLDDWKRKMEDEVDQLKADGDGLEGDEKYDDIAQRLWMRANTRPCPKVRLLGNPSHDVPK